MRYGRQWIRTCCTCSADWHIQCRPREQKPFKPSKYFSIDRVFRNETLDATHLAEFHQIEGVIVDYNLTLGDLIGVLYQFFHKALGMLYGEHARVILSCGIPRTMTKDHRITPGTLSPLRCSGIKKLRFKPAYNPYTEPSMEIFSYHEGIGRGASCWAICRGSRCNMRGYLAGLGRWVEIGNSGMFRPEMLEPMGLPKDVTAIAWGLSLERYGLAAGCFIKKKAAAHLFL